ncbi:MAG: hypothetical protein WAX69_16530 [Victivallales bacterium]
MSFRSKQTHTFPFAAAMPPRAEMNFPSDRWLKSIAAAGYSHVCLQADPFFHPEMQLRDTGENTCHLLHLYDISAGPRRRSYQAWIGAAGKRAADFGLRLTLELWEPRLSRHARQVLPPEWKGPPISGGWVEPLCIGNPEARKWLIENFKILLRASGQIDCLVLGVNDNNAFLCRNCPRCPEPETERLGSLYSDIEDACLEVNQDFRMVVLSWRSNINFFDWAAALNGDRAVDLKAVLSDEIATTCEYRDLCRDPRADHGNSTLAFERMLSMSVPQASADFYHAVECDNLVSWIDPNPFPEHSGDFFAWKIAHLERQIKEL